MYVKFIAHAGIAIEEAGSTLLIDPWFRDSTIDHPILEGINGKQSIEFLLPPAKEKVEDYSPQIILLSHFHTHHSILRDVSDLIANSYNDVLLAHPDCYENEITQKKLGSFRHLTIRPTKDTESFTAGPFTITAYTHVVGNHIAWFIQSKTGKVLHIADGAANFNFDMNSLDAVWDKFIGLYPDILFMSAGRNSLRVEEGGKRTIVESGCFSPIQAARLIQKLQPKAMSSIGNHNHSLKKNRLEFIPDTFLTEEEVRWALDWLAPQTKFIPVRPGHSFSIGESFHAESLRDTYL